MKMAMNDEQKPSFTSRLIAPSTQAVLHRPPVLRSVSSPVSSGARRSSQWQWLNYYYSTPQHKHTTHHPALPTPPDTTCAANLG